MNERGLELAVVMDQKRGQANAQGLVAQTKPIWKPYKKDVRFIHVE